MPINLDKIYKVIRLAIFFAFGALLLFLVAQKVVLTEQLSYGTDFSSVSAFIEGPYPEGRVEPTVVGGKLFEKVINEPIYFNVYSPRKFATVKVTLKYMSPKDFPARFGLRKAGIYDFTFIELPATDNKLNTVNFEFSTDGADRTKNKLQFIISAPGIGDRPDKIFVQSVEFEFVK